MISRIDESLKEGDLITGCPQPKAWSAAQRPMLLERLLFDKVEATENRSSLVSSFTIVRTTMRPARLSSSRNIAGCLGPFRLG
jgi:hypothetical protein